jgi:SAM-dependent methyltransferase
MLSRRAKATFYIAASPLMRVNGILYRRFRAPRNGLVKVHLGPGQHNYLPGWLNVDANMFTGRCDIWADLRNELPFHNGTVDAFYSHHVVEHLPNVDDHFKEIYRCLKPGGVYRVGGPNGDSAIAKFVQKDAAWFSDFPVPRASVGGRLENFLLCRGEHLTILTSSFLEELIRCAGFCGIRSCLPGRETAQPGLFADALARESADDDVRFPHTLIIEAAKG